MAFINKCYTIQVCHTNISANLHISDHYILLWTKIVLSETLKGVPNKHKQAADPNMQALCLNNKHTTTNWFVINRDKTNNIISSVQKSSIDIYLISGNLYMIN